MRTSLRTVLATSMVGAVALAGGAFAAPAKGKTACNLITDPKSDASFLGAAPNDSSLDIVSADLATDGKNLTGVVRVDSFSALSATSPLGRGYYLLFNAPGVSDPIYLNLQVTPDLTRFAWGTRITLPSGSGQYAKAGDATGVVDAEKNELRVTVPLADLAKVAKLKPGAKLSSINASTTSLLGTSRTPSLVATVDDAETSRTYLVGASSCVAVGK